MWQRLKTVVLETAAQEAADLYREQFKRFEESFDALQWLLARKDGLGVKQTRGGKVFWLYSQAGDDLASAPEIWVVYESTEIEVIVHGVSAREIKDDPTG